MSWCILIIIITGNMPRSVLRTKLQRYMKFICFFYFILSSNLAILLVFRSQHILRSFSCQATSTHWHAYQHEYVEYHPGTPTVHVNRNSYSIVASTDSDRDGEGVGEGCTLKAHFHLRKISTDRKYSENVIVKSWKFSTSKFFSDGKFVSANHILQNFLSAENFPEWK